MWSLTTKTCRGPLVARGQVACTLLTPSSTAPTGRTRYSEARRWSTTFCQYTTEAIGHHNLPFTSEQSPRIQDLFLTVSEARGQFQRSVEHDGTPRGMQQAIGKVAIRARLSEMVTDHPDRVYSDLDNNQELTAASIQKVITTSRIECVIQDLFDLSATIDIACLNK